MTNIELIFRVYMIEPRIRKNSHDMPVELILMELNDGFTSNKNEFNSQEEAIFFLQSSTNVKPEREYMIIPSCKVKYL